MNAKQLVKEFIAEKLNGNIELLKDFNFNTLKDSDKYGCQNRPFDCDNSNIMNAIYVVLWGDIFPYCTVDNIGTGRIYRGDTMNTFHTMFGRPIEGRDGFFEGLEKYNPNEEVREKVRTFHKMQRLGNYILLPNIPDLYFNSAANKDELLTMNLYRASAWKDFFDRFLINLKFCLDNNPMQWKFLTKLVCKNQAFFDHVTFDNFVKSCFLSDYMDSNGNPTEIFGFNYHWKNLDDRDTYLSDCESYIEKATNIINHRSIQMIAQLKIKLGE